MNQTRHIELHMIPRLSVMTVDWAWCSHVSCTDRAQCYNPLQEAQTYIGNNRPVFFTTVKLLLEVNLLLCCNNSQLFDTHIP